MIVAGILIGRPDHTRGAGFAQGLKTGKRLWLIGVRVQTGGQQPGILRLPGGQDERGVAAGRQLRHDARCGSPALFQSQQVVDEPFAGLRVIPVVANECGDDVGVCPQLTGFDVEDTAGVVDLGSSWANDRGLTLCSWWAACVALAQREPGAERVGRVEHEDISALDR